MQEFVLPAHPFMAARLLLPTNKREWKSKMASAKLQGVRVFGDEKKFNIISTDGHAMLYFEIEGKSCENGDSNFLIEPSPEFMALKKYWKKYDNFLFVKKHVHKYEFYDPSENDKIIAEFSSSNNGLKHEDLLKIATANHSDFSKHYKYYGLNPYYLRKAAIIGETLDGDANIRSNCPHLEYANGTYIFNWRCREKVNKNFHYKYNVARLIVMPTVTNI